MTTNSEPVLYDVRDRVAWITLNRPDRLNALNEEISIAAIEAVERAASDDRAAVVVLAGAGRAFCAGGDIRAMAERGAMSVEDRAALIRRAQALPRRLFEMPKIVVAAVHGAVMGAGLGVALACDFRIASSDARFGAAHARLGYSGDYGVTWQLTQLLGPARAKAMMISAERFDAARALELGLVSRVVEPSALAEEAAGLAANLAAGPLVAHRHIKANVHAAAAESYADALEREATSNARCGVTDDHREGVAAFIEKREPRFKGR